MENVGQYEKKSSVRYSLQTSYARWFFLVKNINKVEVNDNHGTK